MTADPTLLATGVVHLERSATRDNRGTHMKKVIVQLSVSVDGYVEGPHREIDWQLVDAEFNDFAVQMLEASETLIMGRKTYELMASYWPTAPANDPAVKKGMNDTPKLVFSRTLKRVTWKNARLATASIADEVARLKAAPGDGLLPVGGSELASQFLDHGLVDELRIILTPILLGEGHSIFGNIAKRHPLRLLSTRPFESGNVLLTYEPRRAG
jgi:dihydrofolate reductase